MNSLARSVYAAAAAAAAFLCATPVLAAPTPAGVVDASVNLQSSSFGGSESFHYNFSAPVSFFDAVHGGSLFTQGQLSITSSPIPLLFSRAIVSAEPFAGGLADLNAFERYSFQVLGDPGPVSVHVDAHGEIGIAAFASSALNGLSTVSSLFRLQEGNGAILSDQFISNGVAIDPATGDLFVTDPFQQFTVAEDFLLSTNTIYNVTLRTTLHATASGVGLTDIHASVDPTFTVAGPYSFDFSPGYGGGIVTAAPGGVPEPGAWAFMILGLAGVGSTLRRRQTAPT